MLRCLLITKYPMHATRDNLDVRHLMIILIFYNSLILFYQNQASNVAARTDSNPQTNDVRLHCLQVRLLRNHRLPDTHHRPRHHTPLRQVLLLLIPLLLLLLLQLLLRVHNLIRQLLLLQLQLQFLWRLQLRLETQLFLLLALLGNTHQHMGTLRPHFHIRLYGIVDVL